MSQAQTDGFLDRILHLSDADVSVLEAALKARGSRMATAPGSPNDLLWSDMVAAGWMSKKVDSVETAGRDQFPVLSIRIEEPGIGPLTELLERRSHTRKMVILYNEIYPKVVPEIVDPIRAAGGKPIDVITIVAATVAEVVNYAFKSEFRERSLDEIFQRAKSRLRK